MGSISTVGGSLRTSNRFCLSLTSILHLALSHFYPPQLRFALDSPKSKGTTACYPLQLPIHLFGFPHPPSNGCSQEVGSNIAWRHSSCTSWIVSSSTCIRWLSHRGNFLRSYHAFWAQTPSERTLFHQS